MKPRRGKIILIRSLIFLSFIGMVLISLAVFREVKKKREIQKEIASLQEEAEKISRENANLEEKIGYLQSEDYKKREAKDKLNLQSPGENVIIIKPNLSKDTKTSQDSQIETSSKTVLWETFNPKKWWDYFFK